ncbi:MAG: RdgB/HAM1 family non-canonical purine NTP pyrophosphatase [Candidatus Woesearchaeota archaeon]
MEKKVRRVTFITSNKYKVNECKAMLEPEILVTHKNIPYQEIQANTVEEVSLAAVKTLAEELGEPVIIEDSGLFIDALNGFPGPYTKHVFEKIGNKGILKLLERKKQKSQRSCMYISAIGYCKPGAKPFVFVGKEKGTIAFKEQGKGGWGQDSIFIPEGEQKTYGELREKYDLPNIFRRNALLKLKQFLKKQRR